MTYIPNQDKPGELSTLRLAVDDLILCRRAGGGWDLAKLDQWLQRYPLELSEAVNTLDEVLDEHYPPIEKGGVQHDQHSSNRVHDYRSA